MSGTAMILIPLFFLGLPALAHPGPGENSEARCQATEKGNKREMTSHESPTLWRQARIFSSLVFVLLLHFLYDTMIELSVAQYCTYSHHLLFLFVSLLFFPGGKRERERERGKTKKKEE